MFREEEALEICEELAKKNKLKINILGAKQEEETIIFFFSSSEKRELKNLKSELRRVLQTNIQLKQISPRKKAQKVGGIGRCGLKLCCSTWLKDPVSEEIAAPNPNFNNSSSTAGVCGSFPCCLLFEKENWDKKEKEVKSTQDQEKETSKSKVKEKKEKKKEEQKPKKKRVRKLKI